MLPVFDPTKHHIGLGPAGGVQNGFFLSPGYRRGTQRFAAPPQYGGERDLTTPTVLSRWTMDDLSGGAFQEFYGTDTAMMAYTQNFLPNMQEKSARAVPPLVYFAAAGPIDAPHDLGVFATGGNNVAVADDDRIRFYHAVTGALIEDIDSANQIDAVTHDPTDNRVYMVTRRLSDNRRLLRSTSHLQNGIIIDELPANAPNPCRGLEVTGGRDILLAMGPTLYLADVNDSRNAATFTRIGRMPGLWRDSVTYNGLTYIVSIDNEGTTHVLVWDGGDILPVVKFPFNFHGYAITEYGGRIYVSGRGRDIGDVDVYSELYEITGSSLRMVRSFSDEARAGLPTPTILGAMTVHEGILFCATDKGYLIAYDLTRDALWPAIQVISKTNSRVLNVRELLSTRQKLFAWCFDPNPIANESGFYRLATVDADLATADGGLPLIYTSYAELSDFGPEFDRQKRWSNLRVLTRYGPNPTLEYSLDGGVVWTTAPGVTAGEGNLFLSDFNLASVPPSEHIRLRISFAKGAVAFTEFIGVTLSFLFLDTGKKTWEFTVIAADQMEGVDLGTQTQDVAAIGTTLWDWWFEKFALDFTDLDGTQSVVTITDIGDNKTLIGPQLDDGATREGFHSLTLTEV